MRVIPIKTRIFRENEPLLKFLKDHLPPLKEGDVVAITSKIVALAQGRTAAVGDKTKFIRRESEVVIKAKWCYLAKKDGDWLPNAGIDESNARRKLILLPKNPYGVAEELRRLLLKDYHLKRLGVLITDTRSRPLRAGASGVALAYAGFLGLKDYRGKKDLFGRKLKYTQGNLADALAAAAVAVMGEGREQVPLAVIRNAPVEYSNQPQDTKILFIDPRRDLYRQLFTFYERRSQIRANGRRRCGK